MPLFNESDSIETNRRIEKEAREERIKGGGVVWQGSGTNGNPQPAGAVADDTTIISSQSAAAGSAATAKRSDGKSGLKLVANPSTGTAHDDSGDAPTLEDTGGSKGFQVKFATYTGTVAKLKAVKGGAGGAGGGVGVPISADTPNALSVGTDGCLLATATTYTAGTGINIAAGVISATLVLGDAIRAAIDQTGSPGIATTASRADVRPGVVLVGSPSDSGTAHGYATLEFCSASAGLQVRLGTTGAYVSGLGTFTLAATSDGLDISFAPEGP